MQPLLHVTRCFYLLSFCLFVSCQTVPKDLTKMGEEQQMPDMAPTQLPVGTVHMVDPGGAFVLIQSSRFLPVEAETMIFTVSSNGLETSQLRVSPARKGQFLTADIVSGRPGVGDRAVMTHVPKVGDPASDPLSGTGDSDIQVLE